MKAKLVITLGDVNGIGPEILVKALAGPGVWAHCEPIIAGDAAVLNEARQRFAPTAPEAVEAKDFENAHSTLEHVAVVNAGFRAPAYEPGILNPEAGRCAVEWVINAVKAAQAGVIAGLVTCPITKEGIHKAGYPYPGHTDLIAEMCGVTDYCMSLFTEDATIPPMRIVHVTAHESILNAVRKITRARVAATIRIAHEALVRLGMDHGRIAVAGLNPHAGEAGAFGSEEIEVIAPAIATCKDMGINCAGPFPADTIFTRMQQGDFDLVVAMYHDQGHGPFKLVAMDQGVNVTLGLPIIRTSVDHGTAYDIAGKGQAREASLRAAIALAARFATTGKEPA